MISEKAEDVDGRRAMRKQPDQNGYISKIAGNVIAAAVVVLLLVSIMKATIWIILL